MNLAEIVGGKPPKNYVVYSDYTITDHPEKSATYKAATQLSIETCKQYLKGDYEIIVLSGIVADHQEVFKKNWTAIDELFHKEPCNILFIDSDTVFLNPVEIFNKFFYFTLFNYTDPKCELDGKPYFNCGVRYFPATMNPILWGTYRDWYKDWPNNVWDYEQRGLNKILWHPYNDTNFETVYRPDIVYQAFQSLDSWQDDWNNNVHWLKAGIVHYHGSRGNDRLGTARQMVNIRKAVQ